MTPEPGPVVTIGLKEIYDQLVALNAKFAVLMAEQADSDEKLVDHEGRLRSLERGRWPLQSLTIVIALASLAVAAAVALTR